MSTIVELINERAAKIMEEGGTTEKVINVKAISKADAIEMAIEQLVKEGLIKAPTMTPSERREKLAKARFKTGVYTPKQEPPKAKAKQEIKFEIPQEYFDEKKFYPNYIIFVKEGDSLETYNDDAIKMGERFHLDVETKDKISVVRFPYKDYEDNYVYRLINSGYPSAVVDKAKPEAKAETTPEPKEEVQSRRTTTKPQAKPRKVATELTTADLYKFTGDDGLRPIFNGVHYADGHAEATDAHILIRVPFSYPADYEGKTISKLGNEIEGKYPNTASVIPDISEGNKDSYKAYPFDAEKVLQQCKDLITLTKSLGIGENDCMLQFHGTFFKPIYMKQITEICLKYGGNKIYICPDRYKCCLVPILGGVIILMPTGDANELYINSETNQIVKGPNYSFGTSLHSYLEDNLNTAKQAAEMYQKADAEKEYKKSLSDVKRRESGLEVLGRYQPIRTAPKTRTGATAVARPEKSRLQNLKLFRVPKATEEEQKRFQRRERLAAIRAKRGAEAKQASPKGKTLKLAGKKKVSDIDIDFLPANLRGKEIPTGGDYDDFARKAMEETIGDYNIFIERYTKSPYTYYYNQNYPEVNRDLLRILHIVEAHKEGHDLDSEGNIITNVVDINGNRVRENDWVRVSGSYSPSENRMYQVQPLEGSYMHSRLIQFWLEPINKDGSRAKSAGIANWPMWTSGHSQASERQAYAKHNRQNLKIEIVPKNPVESKATPRYTATKDGIYLPNKTYVPVYFDGGEKDGDSIYVRAKEYDGDLSFLQTETDIVENNSDSMTDYFEKDHITVSNSNPLYDIVRLGALKSKAERNAWAEKSRLDNARREEKRLQKIFDLTKQPQDSLNLLQATKTAKAAEKAYNDKLNESEDLKREIARLERKIKGGTVKQKQENKPVNAKVLKRREKLAAIRAKYGIKPAQESPKGKKLSRPRPKAEPSPVAPTDEPMSIEEAVKFAISMAPTINENAARRAKEMRSFDDYKEGSETASFEAQVREAAKFSKKWPKERSGEFFRLLNTYARRLAEYINRDNEIGTRVPSVLIAGPANFPVRKKQKQVAAWDKNQEFYNEKVAPVLSKLEYPSRQGIKSSDGDALQKLKDKLERMERNQELMKRTNTDFAKAVKEKKTVGEFMQQVSYLSDEMKKEAMYGIKSWHGKPFPPFQLQNANQEMRRLKQRIAEISKIKEAGDGEAENLENKHFGVERDTDLMRYKLTFDGIPAPEIRSVIKKYGARWSPRNMAWLVNLNRNGEYSIKRMIEELDKM